MASVRETLKIEDAVNYGLNILGKGDLVLKDKQLEIIRTSLLRKEMSWLFCQLDTANHWCIN